VEAPATAGLLLCRAGNRLCGVPLQSAVETFRPLPVEPFLAAPHYVLGLAVVRGEPLSVLDVAALLGAAEPPTRFVTVRAGQRQAVLAFSSVAGVHGPALGESNLPPLLSAARNDAVRGLAMLDQELVLLLDTILLLDLAAR
jgi:purine-binding chemotaxis protein CheW